MFALFLDFDGTIIENSCWDVIRDYYGVPSGNWLEDVKNGRKTVQEWYVNDMGLILSKFKRKDLEEMMPRLKKRDDFEKFFATYPKKFDKVAIISSGFPDIVRRFSEEQDIEAFTSTYKYDGEKFSGRVLDGNDKANLLKKFSKRYQVIYVADEPFKGYEVDEYDEAILRICMGEGDSRFVVKNFREAGELIDKIITNSDAYFK